MSCAVSMPTRVTMLVMNDIRHDARVRKEAGTLAKQGFDVTVFGMSEPGQSYDAEPLPFRVIRLPYITKNWPKWRVFWPVKYIECLVRMVVGTVRSNPLVIHAHDLDMLLPAYLASLFLRRRARLIYDSHELWTERMGVPFPGLWRRIERFILPRADGVISANYERAIVMHHEYGAPTLPYVVENCPEVTDLAGDTRLRAFVDSHGHVEKRILLYQGHIMEGRDLHLLVELAAELQSVVLVFVGFGTADYKNKLRDHAVKKGCADRVLFHEPVVPEELVSFTSSADISVVIYPNTCRNNYLCAPNKLYESFMAGLIVVGSNLPPIVRVLHQNRLGLAVDFANPKAAALSLQEYLCDPIALQQARERAREIALSTFNWRKETEQLMALYHAICTEGDSQHD